MSAESDIPPEPADSRALLLDYLSGHDAACPICGYNLRALTSPRCPECGREIELRITLREPWMRAWVTLCIATCAAAGIGLLLLLVFVRSGLPGIDTGFEIASYFFMGCIPLAALVIILRRKFLKLSKPIQIMMVLVACAVTTAMFILLASNI